MTTIPPRRRTARGWAQLLVGLVLAGAFIVSALVAGVMVLITMAPSDPCGPDAQTCAPGALWHLGWGLAIGLLSVVLFLVATALIVRSAPRFAVPPTWPAPPAGWEPVAGWAPPPEWPEPPEGWRFWV